MQSSSDRNLFDDSREYIEEKDDNKFDNAARILRSICRLQAETDKGKAVLSKELFERCTADLVGKPNQQSKKNLSIERIEQLHDSAGLRVCPNSRSLLSLQGI